MEVKEDLGGLGIPKPGDSKNTTTNIEFFRFVRDFINTAECQRIVSAKGMSFLSMPYSCIIMFADGFNEYYRQRPDGRPVEPVRGLREYKSVTYKEIDLIPSPRMELCLFNETHPFTVSTLVKTIKI